MTVRPDPDDVCVCDEFYGYDMQGELAGHAHRAERGHEFTYDARATGANDCAEEATW